MGKVAKQERQVATILDEEAFGIVEDMARMPGMGGRADVVRKLVNQAIVALRAAAAAEDLGVDVNEAVLSAMRESATNEEDPDTRVTLGLLDLHDHHLTQVEQRDPYKAVRLAGGAATALRTWEQQKSAVYAIPAVRP